MYPMTPITAPSTPCACHLNGNNFTARHCTVAQANSVPASFWALALLLLPENQPYKLKVLASLQLPSAAELPSKASCGTSPLPFQPDPAQQATRPVPSQSQSQAPTAAAAAAAASFEVDLEQQNSVDQHGLGASYASGSRSPVPGDPASQSEASPVGAGEIFGKNIHLEGYTHSNIVIIRTVGIRTPSTSQALSVGHVCAIH